MTQQRKPRCKYCTFFARHKDDYNEWAEDGECRWRPEPKGKNVLDWCGQFADKDACDSTHSAAYIAGAIALIGLGFFLNGLF